jgi:hypothetical protein
MFAVVMVWRAAAAVMVLHAWLTGRCRMHGKLSRRPAKKGKRAQDQQETPGQLAHGLQNRGG